jgi:hypothetical protein
MSVFLDQDFFEMVALQTAEPSRIQFLLDGSRLSNYRPEDDLRGSGIPNWINPDVDGDAGVWPSPVNFRMVGNNLDDDDDDGDGHVDMQVRYVCDGSRLLREFSENEGSWQTQVVSRDLSACGFRYYGSMNRLDVPVPDTGNDGIPGTGDTGEGDGAVSEREIDWTLPANGGVGNRSGALDTPAELLLVASIRVDISVDVNHDGIPDSTDQKEILPLLLLSRRPAP